MTKQDKLIKKFEAIREKHKGDEEAIHSEMDSALLEYVDNKEVTRIFELDAKWCA